MTTQAAQDIQQNLLKDLGIDQLPPERQEEILTAMTELILKRITLRILQDLPEEQRKEFDAVCASGDEQKIAKFFSENIPDYENLIQEEIEKFKADMKETVDSLLA